MSKNGMKEIWKDIPGYEGRYIISNKGKIISFSQIVPFVLRQATNQDGYKNVHLRFNGKSKVAKVHQLVAITFLNHEPCRLEKEVNHKNRIKSDNRLINLEVISHRKNCSFIRTKRKHGKLTGSSYSKERGKWASQIWHNNESIWLGYHKTEIGAHRAYKNKLKELNALSK